MKTNENFNNPMLDYDSEKNFFDKISKNISIMFDVGSCDESIYMQFNGIVHYFDPYQLYIDNLKKQPNNNSESFFNAVGLSDTENTIKFYPKSYSLVKRGHSGEECVDSIVIRGDKYMLENNIDKIDFLKIDVECMETFVFRGFGQRLNDVKIIQFEYGMGQAEVGDNLNIMLTELEKYGFNNFYYMYHESTELIPIISREDNWKWCNIVSYNSKYFNSVPWE